MIQQGSIDVKLDGMCVGVDDNKIKILNQQRLYEVTSYCEGKIGCSPFDRQRNHNKVRLSLNGGNGDDTEISVSGDSFKDLISALKEMGLVIPKRSCDLCNEANYMLSQFIKDGYSPQ